MSVEIKFHPINNTSEIVAEEETISITPEQEMAANVEYLSRYFLLPHTLADNYGEYLQGQGFNDQVIEDKLSYARCFWADLKEGVVDVDMLDEEQTHLHSMFQRAAAHIKLTTVDDPQRYIEQKGYQTGANIFVKNILKYSHKEGSEIFIAMGMEPEVANNLVKVIATMAKSTAACMILEGPVANIVSYYAGQSELGAEVANYIHSLPEQSGLQVAAMHSILSTAAFYGSSYLKSIRTRALIEEGVYTVPNIFVGIAALVQKRLGGNKKLNTIDDIKLLIVDLLSLQNILDNLWFSTLFFKDYGVTFSTGNSIATGINLIEVLAGEIMLAKKRKENQDNVKNLFMQNELSEY